MSTFLIYIQCRTANKLGADCWFFSGVHWFVSGETDLVRYESGIIESSAEVVKFAALNEMWQDGKNLPNKALIAADTEIIREAEKHLLKEKISAEMGFSLPYYLEIIPKGTDKGTALQNICRLENIPESETVAFGDMDTDIPMIKKAGMGVAMGNGVDSLKASADLITKTNDEGGIAYALEQILK